MNKPFEAIPDIQSTTDTRHIPIQRVGIKSLRYPLSVRMADGSNQSTVAMVDADVALPAEQKGTHMSRFIEILEAIAAPLDYAGLIALAQTMRLRLQADIGRLELRFPLFVRKAAPVSGVQSLMDYEAAWIVQVQGEHAQVTARVQVPVKALCPCSKEISEYGAHNQRSHITITARLKAPVAFEQLIRMAEEEASCEIWGLLKRPDEKFVTERAYENPKFVEDLVRDVAVRVQSDARIGNYVVEAENFESIHNHSAYARIERV
ncbi:MAG: GTP cyclohydrolase I FolE2 [Betaproteobacteria bacterium]|nr:GTP cyclohydrolase I FolE2 [Betaproteobacteria bacterium]MDE2122476.1 GTP cyclohydrolase I FolE2 [Betaproteobacteria bacterium]MDE2185926.1 GTP cyclohydrolase I FolE2 [Betaproteobacteria bacterium]MDE2323656.1 GTP cyclohydrolase I FolE2 [Betaproteobacteria bacterium]